jgi:hypothetical protein
LNPETLLRVRNSLHSRCGNLELRTAKGADSDSWDSAHPNPLRGLPSRRDIYFVNPPFRHTGQRKYQKGKEVFDTAHTVERPNNEKPRSRKINPKRCSLRLIKSARSADSRFRRALIRRVDFSTIRLAGCLGAQMKQPILLVESNTLGRLDKRLGSGSRAVGSWSRSSVQNAARDSDLRTADYFSFLVVSFFSASIVTSTDAPSLIATSSPLSSFRVLSIRVSR